MQNHASTERIDWFRIFHDLKVRGLSLYVIGARLSIPKSTMNGWRSGSEPKFCEGERLLWLWGEITGKTRADAPTVSRYSHRA